MALSIPMQSTKGYNLLAVGWRYGTLVCQFPGGKYKYDGVPEAECQKLIRSIYPDKLFTQTISKKYRGERIL